MLPAWTPGLGTYFLALFALASLEAVPLWGRFIPGHLGFAAIACVAVGYLGATPWLLVPAYLGAFLSDQAFFAWYRLRPLRTFKKHGAWWAAGLDVDDLAEALRRAPFGTFVEAKFSTRHRARLAYAAGKSEMPWMVFVALSAIVCALWAGAWIGVGALVGWLATQLPPVWAATLLIVAFVALVAGVNRPAASS